MVDKIQHIVDAVLALKSETKKEKLFEVIQKEVIIVGGKKPNGKRLLIDGKYGENTEKAINVAGQNELYKRLIVALGPDYQFKYDRNGNIVKVNGGNTIKDKIMGYLAAVETTELHQNEGESITAPYGIYYKAHPTAKIFIFIEKIAKANNLSMTKKGDRGKLNQILSDEYFDVIRNMAWDFYMHNYIDRIVVATTGPLSALSIFSNGVHAGVGVGNKSLQSVLGVMEDGVIGPKTIRAINAYKGTDEEMNQGVLSYMDVYYHDLVERNADKYYMFLDGWMNRLSGLGYNT